MRHGVTEHTTSRRFSGGLTGANPGLSDLGREQVSGAIAWLAEGGVHIDHLVASPVRRTRESADIVAAVLDREVVEEPGLAEMDFGHWDGLTFEEVSERHGEDLTAWLGSTDVPAGGGESLGQVRERVLAARDGLLQRYAGQTVLAVSHVTPIKTLVTDALGATLDAAYRMDLRPASVTVIRYFSDPERGVLPSVTTLNAGPAPVALQAYGS